MNNKKLAFILIEIIIVLAVLTIVLSIVTSIFMTGNKVFSDSDVKSTLQMEARDIQEELTYISMQGTGITDIKIDNSNCDNESLYIDKKYSELGSIINQMKVNLNDGDKQTNIIYEITGYDKNSEYYGDGSISNPQVYNISFNDGILAVKFNNSNKFKILSEHVKSFDVLPQDTNDKFANTLSIKFNIVLHKEKGSIKVDYPTNIKVTFRNKT